ncbi:hypothetical protein FB446DRAFT_773149 [Lentinula raphanica]|nr:hypothetical protein FB446DRAFT_773149 [Lentinula raphanica]
MTKSPEFGKVLDGMVREKGTGAGGVLSKEKDEWEWEVYERIKLGGAVILEDSSKRQNRDVLGGLAHNPPLPATPSQHPPLPAWALKEQDVHTDPSFDSEPVRVKGYLEMNRTVIDVTYFWCNKFDETLFGIEIYT